MATNPDLDAALRNAGFDDINAFAQRSVSNQQTQSATQQTNQQTSRSQRTTSQQSVSQNVNANTVKRPIRSQQNHKQSQPTLVDTQQLTADSAKLLSDITQYDAHLHQRVNVFAHNIDRAYQQTARIDNMHVGALLDLLVIPLIKERILSSNKVSAAEFDRYERSVAKKHWLIIATLELIPNITSRIQIAKAYHTDLEAKNKSNGASIRASAQERVWYFYLQYLDALNSNTINSVDPMQQLSPRMQQYDTRQLLAVLLQQNNESNKPKSNQNNNTILRRIYELLIDILHVSEVAAVATLDPLSIVSPNEDPTGDANVNRYQKVLHDDRVFNFDDRLRRDLEPHLIKREITMRRTKKNSKRK